MKQIYLLRHEEVVKKYRNRYYGHLDVNLSTRGKVRALRTAKRLNLIKFDAIYCSDLSRATFILDELKQKKETLITKDLREMCWGKHEGLAHKHLENMGFKYENFEQWLSQFDGESLDEFQSRVLKYYAQIVDSKRKKVLLITHSGVIRAILAYINGTTIEQEFLKPLKYGTLTKIRFRS